MITLNQIADELNVAPIVLLTAMKEKKIKGQFSRLYHCWVIVQNKQFRDWVKELKKSTTRP